jgi:diacylglycerol kinase family enzyme
VKEYIGREVTVEADGRMFLQAEGDLFGEAPAAFKILPRALRVLV